MTSTKRPDGGEHTYLGYSDEKGNKMYCAHAKCLHESMCRNGCTCPVVTPTNESPAPQAGEADGLSQQLLDGAKRAGVDDYTATLLMHASDLIDRLSAAPQPPVEGLRENGWMLAAFKQWFDANAKFMSADVGLETKDIWWRIWKAACNAALASPSLTAGQSGQKT